ncbi:MAG: hypothetical protein NC300_05450 [Bacteroidales bacterium]|nr:hypothetical protein [Clostridium sp.]MCM1203568.1 hypothetical protein [Bacteroidales bacterium]
MKLLFAPAIIVLLWVLHHNIKKSKLSGTDNVRSYLEQEALANRTRRQDLSKLPYIDVPLDSFPFDITLNDEKKQLKIAEYQKEIEQLAQTPMLNLIGITNTELKAAYGPANLEQLSIFDQSYTRYLRILQAFAECIYEEYPEKAVSILEYCLSIGTDISGTYHLLGQYYLGQNELERFLALYDKIPVQDSISGRMIISRLDRLKEQDN